MGFNIVSGSIEPKVLYLVVGVQSVTYNGTTYTTGQTFLGISGVTTYTLSGGISTAEVDEVTKYLGFSLEIRPNSIDLPTIFPEITVLSGFAIEFNLNKSEQITQEVTQISGFTIELVDYPFYGFEIIETRLR